MVKLSIIIPYYNLENYIGELLDCLDPQITDEVQVVLVDDGSIKPFKTSYEWVEVIRQENKGLSNARNVGLENVKGEYVSFIDADDVVAKNYISYILNKIDAEHFDYMDLSWKSLPGEVGGVKLNYKLNSDNDSLPNPSVCTRVFKKTFIGNQRFNEKKKAAEDEDFTRRLNFEGKKKSVATEYMYFYRTTTPNSLSKRYMNGSLGMKRIVYYFKHVTKSMTYLIDEFRNTYEESEIFLLTEKNDIPELEKYCSIWKPQPMRGMELRGEPFNMFTKIDMPITCDVVIFTARTFSIGGIETFIYNFCCNMHKLYNIVVLYEIMDPKQIERLKPYVKIVKNDAKQRITCKTLIMNRVFDRVPSNVEFKQIIQMVHACSDCCSFSLPQDRDKMVIVSDAAKQSWGSQAKDSVVINNITHEEPCRNPLILITASRLDTSEKGQRRMIKLAQLFDRNNIPYVWLYFSNTKLTNAPQNLVYLKPTLDIRGFIRKADYLVQLSDSESFCYSIVEALEEGVPVITTPLPVLKEIGVNEKNSYIVPFEIPDDYDVEKIFVERKKKFRYKYDNESIVSKWKAVLDNIEDKQYKEVEIIANYRDILLNRDVKKGERLTMESHRARKVMNAGYCKVLN